MNESVDKKSSPEKVLDKVTPDRRNFVQGLLGISAYAAPIVASFVIASGTAEPAEAAPMWT